MSDVIAAIIFAGDDNSLLNMLRSSMATICPSAERLTGYLKAEHLLVYKRGEVKDLLIQG